MIMIAVDLHMSILAQTFTEICTGLLSDVSGKEPLDNGCIQFCSVTLRKVLF
jgi:hypothetical protein